MKRLKKKAWDKISLYHGTSSQLLLQIISEGQISPSGYTGQVSNGVEGDGSEPSGDLSGVYLTDDFNWANEYASRSMNNYSNPELPNIGVVLKVEIDTDALQPDYDVWKKDEYNLRDGEEPWKSSLRNNSQVLHSGPIDNSNISLVFFGYYDDGEYEIHYGSILENHPEIDFEEFAEEYLSEKASLQQAQNELQNFHKTILELDSSDQKQAASQPTRLIKNN